MSRVMAIDYGTKRVGIAVTDTLQIIASPLDTVHASEVVNFIEKYCGKEDVATIVIGEPKKLNNESADIEQHIKGFIRNLQKCLPTIEIQRVDERFTSKIAFQSMIDSGLSKKKRSQKEIVDQVSATLILQSYLEKK
ncbi:MAG: Holliday junction resolvase RuvX [Flavobacteriales bacterium]|jgi:putative holliday junction resolvase|nr:Holliday junction resolvase RuvX [Flavobacteriales bacterium]